MFLLRPRSSSAVIPWRAGTTQFRSDWSAIWVYNPRNGILMQHGFEESGDVQDIRLVVDTIPTLAWSAGPDGSAQFFNQRWLDYTGLSAEQALGSGWQVAIHPDELPRILETFREALNSGGEYRVLRKGTNAWTCLPGIPGGPHDEPGCF